MVLALALPCHSRRFSKRLQTVFADYSERSYTEIVGEKTVEWVTHVTISVFVAGHFRNGFAVTIYPKTNWREAVAYRPRSFPSCCPASVTPGPTPARRSWLRSPRWTSTTFSRRSRRLMSDTPHLRSAATVYASRSITVCPLCLDSDGIAKVPVSDLYPRFHTADNLAHDWSEADGLGIVLGRPSGNMAVIDVDDAGLSEYLIRHLQTRDAPPLMVETAHRRLHIYCVEPTPSR